MLDHRKISHNFCLQAAKSVVRMFVDTVMQWINIEVNVNEHSDSTKERRSNCELA